LRVGGKEAKEQSRKVRFGCDELSFDKKVEEDKNGEMKRNLFLIGPTVRSDT